MHMFLNHISGQSGYKYKIRSFIMTEGKRPASEIYATRNHLHSAGAEMEDDREHPIISLSKSFTDMASGPPQRMELAWCWQNIRKSASSAVCPQRPASMGGPVRDVQATLEFEQGSTYSGNSTPETVIWHGGTTRPWSITEDSPARTTPTQEHFLGRQRAYTSERCTTCSPAMHRDLRMECLEGRETCCQHSRMAGENLKACNCSRMVCGMMSPALSSRPCLRSAHSLAQQGVDAEVCTFKGDGHHLPGSNTCRAACVSNALNAGSLGNSCTVVPCPGHLISLPACGGSPCPGQRSLLHSNLLGFPPLVSSVSETGLNNRAAGHCCGSELGGKNPSALKIDHSSQSGFCHRTMRDASTMTSEHDFKEVGVQTMSSSPVSHLSDMFTGISLTDGPSSDIFPTAEDAGTRTPIKEVEWDAEGMTWEVYGASLDPEELGLAIQRHLELQIKETAEAAAAEKKTSVENDCGSRQQSKKRKGGSVVQSLRRPACCSRSSTVED
ncbi:hypothetical protein AMEX_G18806 [Astyanax mexicanus]|uniref:G protein-regulated inducer of neurite outgrowth C-terminal domain-containing protein n=2 Tax=Astyanax mexicanus TaxID=7994 RepID=A0A8T2L7J4_ASTMX|nr:hypothetical protein AMEX_G18806 [Astyanax mexicanus]